MILGAEAEFQERIPFHHIERATRGEVNRVPRGLVLWGFWSLGLVLGILGMGWLSEGIVQRSLIQGIFGLSVFMFGFWISANILASAKRAWRARKTQSPSSPQSES